LLLIKRNTPEFKAIKTLISDYTDKATAKKFILLYSLKPYQNLSEKILLNTLKKDSAVLYSLAYDGLREYIFSKNKKLFRDDSVYYFKSNSDAKPIEQPFAFKGKLKKELAPLLAKPVLKATGKVIQIGRGTKKKKGV
jgi:hypothetical protein